MIANVDVATTTFSPRVMELRQKIHDEEWVDFAVQRIAQVLSRRLVDGDEQVLTRKTLELVETV
ncbi:MAG: hypothetical protein II684_07030 [Treponema sp.]|jgi:hypothetical protein|nr:hypothetical protein [Treponema sp.]MBR4463550.1 hypothetical protein [Treponema sp.]